MQFGRSINSYTNSTPYQFDVTPIKELVSTFKGFQKSIQSNQRYSIHPNCCHDNFSVQLPELKGGINYPNYVPSNGVYNGFFNSSSQISLAAQGYIVPATHVPITHYSAGSSNGKPITLTFFVENSSSQQSSQSQQSRSHHHLQSQSQSQHLSINNNINDQTKSKTVKKSTTPKEKNKFIPYTPKPYKPRNVNNNQTTQSTTQTPKPPSNKHNGNEERVNYYQLSKAPQHYVLVFDSQGELVVEKKRDKGRPRSDRLDGTCSKCHEFNRSNSWRRADLDGETKQVCNKCGLREKRRLRRLQALANRNPASTTSISKSNSSSKSKSKSKPQ